MTGRAVSALLAALTIAALSGCASSGGAAGSTDPGDSSAGTAEGDWRAPDTDSAWLTLAEGKVTGNDGCNPVNGSYQVAGDEVTFDLELTTLKACVGVTLSFAPLATATVDADTLTLYGADRAEIIALTRG